MRMFLSTMMAVALVGPASLAYAEDPAASRAKNAGEEAIEAGAKAEKAGATAEAAGERAEKAGQKAERAGDKAQQEAEAGHAMSSKHDQPGEKQARQAVRQFEKADPGLTRLFDGAAAYAVFPTVGKGAVGVGGAHGTGVLYEKGTATGKVTLTQLTVGLQLGGQAYSEVIFLETKKTLSNFKKGEFAMAAQASAVAVTAGASANAEYVEGVSVFTLAKGGAMAEASVGGQKFSYAPFHPLITSSSR